MDDGFGGSDTDTYEVIVRGGKGGNGGNTDQATLASTPGGTGGLALIVMAVMTGLAYRTVRRRLA